MPSTYTTNLGIEKIATGEQSGTWGATTNTNFDLIDQAINGIVAVTLASAGSSGSPNTLAITDGSASDGRNKFIEFVDGGDLGATAYVQLTPNDAEKIVIIRNSLSGSQSLIVFQGTYNASNDFEVPNGNDVVLKFDGAGTGATVTQVFDDLLIGALSATTVDATTLQIGGTSITATATEINRLDGVASALVEADDIGTSVLAYDANLQGFVDAFTLPTSDGSTDQALITNGSGTISFGSAGISTGKAIAMAIVFG